MSHDAKVQFRRRGEARLPTSVYAKVQRAVLSRQKAENQVESLKWVVEQLIDEVGDLRERVNICRREETLDLTHTSTPEHGSNHTPIIGATIETRGLQDEHNEQVYKQNSNAEVIMPTTTSGLASAVQRVSQEGGGKEVILLSTERPRDQAVAKATVQTIDPEARVGGCVLGTDCYEVVVNTLIMRGDHLLPRQYGKMKTLADSVGRSIAWPHMNIMVEESAPGNSRIQ